MAKLKKNFYLFSFFAILACIFSFLGLKPGHALAVSASDWQAGHIIDDSVFFNPNTMTTQEIQDFLNSKVPSCDTNGTISKSYYYNSSTGEINNPNSGSWVTTSRAIYGQRYDTAYNTSIAATPYTCLKDYSQTVNSVAANSYCGAINSGSMSAATIIKTVAAACSVNPQVLLVTLQKEEGLVTDDWPWTNEYQIAMGYGCPDPPPGQTVNCNADYYGFFNQVYNAAHQFQRYVHEPQNFNFAAGRTSNIYYSPVTTACPNPTYSSVTIQNGATAALYNYTPYQPNQAALDAGYGPGDNCSAYGNRNFWLYFWDWFGNPIGPDYSWLIQSFTYSGGDNNLTQGQPETLILKALNTSRHPWYKAGVGNNPVRLGTWLPGRASPLLNGGTRYSDMQENEVDPNQVATFAFTIAPSTLGTFVEPMNLVAENATWMAWPGFSPTINVTGPYQWQIQDIIYGNGTGVMDPGTKQLVTVKALNTGNVTWSKTSGPTIRLGTWLPGRASAVSANWLSSTRVADMNEPSVAPGQVAGFQFYVNMPSSGNYYERLNLVAEGQSWFNDPGLTLYLHGNSYSWKPLWWAYSTGGDANLARGTDFTITLKVQNTGEATWSKTNFPVRLATTAPQNRGSFLYDPNWLSPIRPAGLQENSVAPGQQGTFIFNAHIPADAALGPHNERFSLVSEGLLWMNDPGLYMYVNVK